MPLTGAIRRRIGAVVFERAVGTHDPELITRPYPRLSEADRLFSADRPVRQVHNDCAMLVGGISAVLLQSVHPLVAAAVADHSGGSPPG